MKLNDNQQFVIAIWAVFVFLGVIPNIALPYVFAPNNDPNWYLISLAIYWGLAGSVGFGFLVFKFRTKDRK